MKYFAAAVPGVNCLEHMKVEFSVRILLAAILLLFFDKKVGCNPGL